MALTIRFAVSGTMDKTANSSENRLFTLDPLKQIDVYLTASHCVGISVGIPLNLWLMLAIIRSRRLHAPRHFLWLGVGFSNIFILSFYAVEVVAAHFDSWMAHVVYNWVIGLTFPSLIVNMVFSLIDRYICLTYAVWYRTHVSGSWILCGQMFCFGILCTVVKGNPLLAPRPWPWKEQEYLTMSTITFGLTVLCLMGQVIVWPICRRTYPAFVQMYQHHPLASVPQPASTSSDLETSPFVLIGDQRVSRLDVEAARNATASVVALGIFMAPGIGTMILLSGCLYLAVEATQSCSTLLTTLFYFRELILFHSALFNPIAFVVNSREVSSALWRN